jgi:hypothetical protein
MIIKSFLITTVNTPAGVMYTFEQQTGTLCGVQIKEYMPLENSKKVFETLIMQYDDFINYWKPKAGVTITEITANITFDMFWKKYDDASRSSRKRSLKIWEKLNEDNRIKAYYFYDTYLNNKGNAEKKYCETYLSAEMWNN